MAFNQYPYTDFHELNLDWILAEIKKLHNDWDDFKIVNSIRFYGNWDITSNYPAWSLVSVNNTGYISVQAVPSGVAIENSIYWKLVADYSALLADMQQRIVDLEGRFADGKVFIGDSYGVDLSAGGKAWSSYVRDVYPDSVINCVGGTGFSSDVYITQNFLSMLQSVPVSQRNNIASIFVFGGANDANLLYDGRSSSELVIQRINQFCEYAKNNFVHATVYIGFIGWYKQAGRLNKYIETAEAYKSGAINNSNCVYISGLEPIMKNADYINSSDLIHPTAEASATLAEYILNAVGTKSAVHYFKVFETEFTKGPDITAVNGMTTAKNIVYDGETVTLTSYGSANGNMNIDFRISASLISFGTTIILGKYSNSPQVGNIPPAMYAPAIISSGSRTTNVHVKLSLIQDGTIAATFLDSGLNEPGVIQILINSPIRVIV